MPSLFRVLGVLLAAMAVGAWAVVIYSVLAMVPVGRQCEAVGLLGRWQLVGVGHLAGEHAAPHASRYLRAMMFFLGILACFLVMAILAYINAQIEAPAP